MGTPHASLNTINTTVSDWMVALFQDRHSGMDSPQAILPGAHRVNATVFPTDLCRNPGTWTAMSLPSMALDIRFPAGMTNLQII